MLEDDTSRRDGSIVGTERCVPFNFGGHSKRVLTHSSDNLRTNVLRPLFRSPWADKRERERRTNKQPSFIRETNN